MELHNLLPQYRHYYHRNCSTKTALLKVEIDALLGMVKQLVIPLDVMDLSAAFGTIDHIILLYVLCTNFGVEGTAFYAIRLNLISPPGRSTPR